MQIWPIKSALAHQNPPKGNKICHIKDNQIRISKMDRIELLFTSPKSLNLSLTIKKAKLVQSEVQCTKFQVESFVYIYRSVHNIKVYWITVRSNSTVSRGYIHVESCLLYESLARNVLYRDWRTPYLTRYLVLLTYNRLHRSNCSYKHFTAGSTSKTNLFWSMQEVDMKLILQTEKIIYT